MSAFNNNNSANPADRVANMNSTTVQPSNQLNENHGIAASGLNDPLHAQGSQGLNHSGAPIANTHGTNNPIAGQDLNRTGNMGVPGNAEQIRRHNNEDVIGGNHHGNLGHHTATTTGPTSTGNAAANAAASATGSTTVGNVGTHHHDAGLGDKALHGSHGVTGSHTNPVSTGVNTGTHHQGVGLDEKALHGSHGVTGSHTNPVSAGVNTHQHEPHHTTGAGLASHQQHNDPTSVGATSGTHTSGAPLGTGLPNKDQKHVGDQHFNDKHGNLDHPKHDTLDAKHKKEDTTKVSATDKIKGNLEKMAGKITGNEAKVIQGENIAQGRAV